MKFKSIVTAVCSVAVSTALLCGLSACSGEKAAATVGSSTIAEQKVTDYIQNFRASNGYEDDSTFATILSLYGMTPEDFREDVINSFVNEELMKQAIKEKGITVDKADIDAAVASMKSRFSNDAAWQNALKSSNLTEKEYRDLVEERLLENKFYASFGVSDNPTEEQIVSVAKDNLKYFANAKRSSHILFDLEDEATAKEVLEKLNNGSLEFAEAAATYSKDGSGEQGGDVGWDILTSFVPEYQAGLDALSVGQMSGLVESQYGYHIILCTEMLKPADQINALSDLPEAFQTFFTQLATTGQAGTQMESWLKGYKTTVKVTINPMPKGLPYDVELESEGADAASSSSASN